MPDKNSPFIAAILTAFILVAFSVLSVLTQMLALNGASERQGVTAMGISLGCQGVSLLLAILLARFLTRTFIQKFNWRKWIAIAAAVFASTFIGSLLAIVSFFLSIPIAGIK